MTASKKHRIIFWAPRALSVAFALFLSLFALDVFGQGQSVLRTLAALAIHLVPVYLVLLTLWIAWKREWVGTLVYATLGVLYIVDVRGRFPWQTMAAISGPLFAMAALFLASWFTHPRRHTRAA